MSAHGRANRVNVVPGQRAGLVAPRAADVSQNRRQIVVGQSGAHRRHGHVPVFALNLDVPRHASERDVGQPAETLGVHPFGTRQRRRRTASQPSPISAGNLVRRVDHGVWRVSFAIRPAAAHRCTSAQKNSREAGSDRGLVE